MARNRILGRLGREAAAKADDTATRAANRARQAWRDILNGGRFTCACCPGREFRGHRALNAHHAARHTNRWVSAKARKTARAMGKAKDDARRHARGWLESAGLRNQAGRHTDRARSRPELRGRVTIRQLRDAHRHDRTHEKAARLTREADTHAARGNHIQAWQARETARDLRDRWPVRTPASNGTRPAPERTGRTR